MAVQTKVHAAKQRLKTLQTRKTLWLTMYQFVGMYIMLRKQNFLNYLQPGSFLTDRIFDSTAVHANAQMAASLLGALWPNGARSFKIVRPPNLPDTKEVKDFFIWQSQTMTDVMDDTKGGLPTALSEYMLDQGSFGISGISVLENKKDPAVPIRYRAINVKNFVIDEGEDGFVDTVYIEEELTLRQAVQRYGVDALSSKSRESFKNRNFEQKLKILIVIEPRLERNPKKLNNKNMPVMSLHIEMGTEKILKESGFEEMPYLITRFLKALGEIYGRSSGMLALPDILQLNTIMESVMIASEKKLDPPLMVTSDGTFSDDAINTSAGGITVVSVSGRIGQQKVIEPLFDVGEFNSTLKLAEVLKESISQAYFIDRLLDLNNNTRMTLGEARIRDRLRGESLSSLFTRQEAELFNPLIERTYNILLRRGRLGVVRNSQEEKSLVAAGIVPKYIPDVIVKAMERGEEVYRIQYFSPAKRLMQAEEARGIAEQWDFAANIMAPIAPTVMDMLNADEAIKRWSVLVGAPEETLNSTETVKGIRAARAAQEKATVALEAAKGASDIVRNVAQAEVTSGAE